MVNLMNKIPLSQKQKDAQVMSSLLKEHGNKFYDLPLEERSNMREQRYAELFLGAPKPEVTSEQHTAAFASLLGESLAASLNEPVTVDYRYLGQPGYTEDSEEFSDAASKPEALAPEPVSNALITMAEAKWDKVHKTVEGEFIPAEDDDARLARAKDAIPDPKETFSLDITLNERQQLAVEYAENGKCFVYTGAAGTGKTTGCREIAKILLRTGKLKRHDFKVKNGGGRWHGPSIAFCAYTNRASNNMMRALHKDPLLEKELSGNILTIHSLLEYEPVFFLRDDGTTGMRFEPKRTRHNPLRITHLVIEESSMLGIDLWLKLYDALLPGTQIIFVGDINQLPPVFSKSILNYALITLPVVELNEVYRQALDSPIIANAHRCLKGEKLEDAKPFFRVVQKKRTGDPKKDQIPSENLCVTTLVNSLKTWNNSFEKDADGNEIEGQLAYDPETDIILCPYGKEGKHPGAQASSKVLNDHIAQFLGAKRKAMVYEIIAGMRKLYLAEGDRVMFDKQDGYIARIVHNGNYVGRVPKPASTELTRFGMRVLGNDAALDEDFELTGYENLDVSKIADEGDDDSAKKRQASHIVDILLDNGRTVSLSTAGEFSEQWFSLGYALTVHKAQGCEWRKVILLMHRNHATLLNRELVYTAITRAREYCMVVDLCNMVDKAIANQRIKGDSIEAKIEWFNAEISLEEPVPVIP